MLAVPGFLVIALLWGSGGLDAIVQSATAQGAEPALRTLRTYGFRNEGAGALAARDIQANARNVTPEDLPYSDSLAVFLPQRDQSPRKDFVTWNPAWMSEDISNGQPDELESLGFYGQFEFNQYGASLARRNASEKVRARTWYEPAHLDLDLDFTGGVTQTLTLSGTLPLAPPNPTPTNVDEWYPAIMQEFTYELIANGDPVSPTLGVAGTVNFALPMASRFNDLSDATFGYGLTSFDANFDGIPDIVTVDSELSLASKTNISADFDGDGALAGLDTDGLPLSGDELAVFHTPLLDVPAGGSIQFMDHLVKVVSSSNTGTIVQVSYVGDIKAEPSTVYTTTLLPGNMLVGYRGSYLKLTTPGGNLNQFNSLGPWFVYIDGQPTANGSVRLMVGRALGYTYTAMLNGRLSPHGISAFPNSRPWWIKRVYVDGHEYNVVALYTAGSVAKFRGPIMQASERLDSASPDDANQQRPTDPTAFGFITLRSPVPKVRVRLELHTITLQHYVINGADPGSPAGMYYLPMLPPFNYEHHIRLDVQKLAAWNIGPTPTPAPAGSPTPAPTTTPDLLGPIIGPVPPILQANGPFPYTARRQNGIGPTYDSPRESFHFYTEETTNPQFLGQLAEKYGDTFLDPFIDVQPENEFFYVEQYWTLPWQYTDFVFPDIAPSRTGANAPDLYLLTSAFDQPRSGASDGIDIRLYAGRTGPLIADTSVPPTSTTTGALQLLPRVKFWFDPAESGKKYKDDTGVRLYGSKNQGAGFFRRTTDNQAVGTDTVQITNTTITRPVEVPRYRDAWAPFNPQLIEAPRSDSMTFNPALLGRNDDPLFPGEFRAPSEPNLLEKTFFRQYYAPEYLHLVRSSIIDSAGAITLTSVYTFPAVVQEFTYMYVNTSLEPAHAPPGSTFALPMATGSNELPKPDSSLNVSTSPQFGYGLTTFDADFDGQPDRVKIYSERYLTNRTGINADFNGNGSAADSLAPNGQTSGTEMALFAVEGKRLAVGQSLQFLDTMISLESVSRVNLNDEVRFKVWRLNGTQFYPVACANGLRLNTGQMGIVRWDCHMATLSPGDDNYGAFDGPWFVYVESLTTNPQEVYVTVGRALGAPVAAMTSDGNSGVHDNYSPGAPWYLKRFFVDGHEYNVVALKVVQTSRVDDPFDFKYITIRTPVPKVPFRNTVESYQLQGYFLQGYGHPDAISLLPPYNTSHLMVPDITRLTPAEFANPDTYLPACRPPDNQIILAPPLGIQITDERREPQFWGELKEIRVSRSLAWLDGLIPEDWLTEQFRLVPDSYTEFRLSDPNQYYLIASQWTSTESRLHFYGCSTIPELDTQDGLANLRNDITDPNGGYLVYAQDIANTNTTAIPNRASVGGSSLAAYFDAGIAPGRQGVRVKFTYKPNEPQDIYVNPYGSNAQNQCPVVGGTTLIGPGARNGAQQCDTRPIFSWNATPGATFYQFQIDTSPGFGSAASISLNTTSVALNSPLAVGVTYYWRVRAFNGCNTGDFSDTFSFTIPGNPTRPTLVSPANSDQSCDNTPTFVWTGGPFATSFRLQVDDDPAFGSPAVDIAGLVATSFTVTTPLASETYYWRVQSANDCGVLSNYTASRQLTIQDAPAPPGLSLPVAGSATCTPVSLTFVWNAVAGANGYRIQVDNDSDFASPLIDQTTFNTNLSPGLALPPGTYYWHVKALNNPQFPCDSGYGDTRTFIVQIAPATAPVPVAPGDGAITCNVNPTFQWNALAGATLYRLQVDDNADFSSPAIDTSTGDTQYTVPTGAPLSNNTTYYWRVMAQNNCGSGPFSTPRQLFIRGAAATPTLLDPANGASTCNPRPAYNWTSVANAVSYQFQLSSDAAFSEPLVISATTASTGFTPGSNLAPGAYYWRVRAATDCGPGDWTLGRSVIINAIPDVPALGQPANGAALCDPRPVFTWNVANRATSYRIQVDNNSDFSSPEINQTTASTSFTPGSDLAPGAYSWRVSASDVCGDSAFSAARTFTILPRPAGPPSLTSPPNGAVLQGTVPVTFTWTTVAGATSYRLQVDDEPGFGSPAVDVPTAGNSYATYLPGSQTYYWRVRAESSTCPTDYSPAYSFTLTNVLPAPECQSNILANPGFEDNFNSWTASASACAPLISTQITHSGQNSALIGVPTTKADKNCDSFVYQQVSIPAGTSQALLRFWYWAWSDEGNVNYDWQELQIRDSNGNLLQTLWHVNDNSRTWKQSPAYDLSPYAGQTIRIYFNVHNDGHGGLRTFLYLDDVSLSTCSTQLTIAPASQQVSQGGQVTVDLRVEGITNLYGADVTLNFNKDLLEVVDADGNGGNGVQIQPGTFLNPANATITYNMVDNSTGMIRFAISLLNPAPAATGSGVLARVTFRGKTVGTSPVAWTSISLRDVNGNPLNAGGASASIQVVAANGGGTVTGKVLLEGRSNHSGTSIVVDGLGPVNTAADGAYTVNSVPAGSHTITAQHNGYLTAQRSVTVGAGATVVLPDATLLAGDLDNTNNVGLTDLVLLASNYGLTVPPADSRADINGDHLVNLADLVLLAHNYGLAGPTGWVSPSAPASASALGAAKADDATALTQFDAPTQREGGSLGGAPHIVGGAPDRKTDNTTKLVISPAVLLIKQAGRAEFDLKVENVHNLYAVDIIATFEPDQLEVVDDAGNPITSISPGTFLNVGGGNGFVLTNVVDNAAGVIHFVATQLNPAPAVSGTGSLARVRVRAKGAGRNPLAFGPSILMDGKAQKINVVEEDGIVLSGELTQLYLPNAARNDR
ncbi:MAG: hypothetical protein EXR62_11795 [Chloroflexi bacterium]|nr:hypothetical protein [Chloroflexota bacterium]